MSGEHRRAAPAMMSFTLRTAKLGWAQRDRSTPCWLYRSRGEIEGRPRIRECAGYSRPRLVS